MLQQAYEQIPPSRALVPIKSPGRPSLYSTEVAVSILHRLAAGETLKAICRDKDLPAESTVRLWAIEDRAGFSARYAKARMVGYLGLADEVVEISDAKWEDPACRRVRVDTRKWMLAKMLPKVFGDKVQHDHSGTVTVRHEDWLKQLK